MNVPQIDDQRAIRNERRAFYTTVVFAVLILIALWTFVAVTTTKTREEDEVNSARVLERMTYSVEEQARRMFKMVEIFLVSVDHWMQQNPTADPREDARLGAMIRDFRVATGGIVHVGVVAADGQSFALSDESGHRQGDVSGSDYFIALRERVGRGAGQLFVGEATRVPDSGRGVLPVAMPLSMVRHGLVMARASIDVDALMGMFDQQRPPAGGTIALVRTDGRLLARVPAEIQVVGRSVAGGALFRHMETTGRTRDVVVQPSAIDGVVRQFSYAALQDYPLVVVVSARWDQVMADWKRDVRIALAVATMLSSLVLLTLWWQLRLLRSLASSREQLEVLAATDAMTETFNHSAFIEILGRDFARSRRYGEPLSVMMLDIDFFKRINDGYGHAVGDEALRAFARVLKDELRNVDIIGRLGGEEFGIILPNTALLPAIRLAERLRDQVAGIVVTSPTQDDVRFTTSVGVAQMDVGDIDPDHLLGRADEALYAAKERGRNRVEPAPSPVESD